jgi:hypothetical protein
MIKSIAAVALLSMAMPAESAENSVNDFEGFKGVFVLKCRFDEGPSKEQNYIIDLDRSRAEATQKARISAYTISFTDIAGQQVEIDRFSGEVVVRFDGKVRSHGTCAKAKF